MRRIKDLQQRTHGRQLLGVECGDGDVVRERLGVLGAREGKPGVVDEERAECGEGGVGGGEGAEEGAGELVYAGGGRREVRGEGGLAEEVDEGLDYFEGVGTRGDGGGDGEGYGWHDGGFFFFLGGGGCYWVKVSLSL